MQRVYGRFEGPFDESHARRMCERASRIFRLEASKSGVSTDYANWISRLFSQFSQIQLYGDERPASPNSKADSSSGASGPPEAAGAKGSTLSRILWVFFCYRWVHCSLNMIFQYAHDYYLIKLRIAGAISAEATPAQVVQIAASNLGANSSRLAAGQADSEQLLSSFATSRRLLEAVGSPFRDFTMMVELVHVVELWLILLLYFRPYLMHRAKPFNYGPVKMLVDGDRERLNYTRLSIKVLNTIVASSRHSSAGQSQARGFRLQAQQQQRLLVGQLSRLALRGRLEPLNRGPAHLAAMDRSRRLVTVFFFVTATCCYMAVIVFALFHGAVRDIAPVYLRPVDVFATVSYVLSIWLIIGCSSLILSTTTAMIVDREALFREITRAAQSCSALVRQQVAGATFPAGHLSDQLTLLLLSYKLAVAHMRPLQSTMECMCFLMAEVLVVGPLAAILHAPFFDGRAWPVLSLIFFGISSTFDICLIRICRLNARARDLYKATASSLAAQVQLEASHSLEAIRAGSEPSASYAVGAKPAACHPDIVWLLRAELAHPHRFMELVSIKLAGSVFGYTRYLRLHFWSYLILCVASLTAKRASSSRLTNPIGNAFLFVI